MSKKIVVISTSLRANSNSNILAEAFAKGAKDAGHEVEFISLRGKRIDFYKGCLACQKTSSCVIQDDANEITEKVLISQVVAFATPIYYYGLSGQKDPPFGRRRFIQSFPKKYDPINDKILASSRKGQSEDHFLQKENENGRNTNAVSCNRRKSTPRSWQKPSSPRRRTAPATDRVPISTTRRKGCWPR